MALFSIKNTNMLKPFLLLLFPVCFTTLVNAQSADEKAIRAILADQTRYWNEGDLELFMLGYLDSDSLMFVGRNGVTYGYQQTLANYHKNYPDKQHMGSLEFTILQVKKLSSDHYFVVGKFHLTRTIGDASGHFTLLWKKIKGKWKIIADHSS